MALSFHLGPLRHVDFLLAIGTGDPVVLHSGVKPNAIGWMIGPDVLEVEVVADVAIELAVIEIAGITFGGTPHLLGGIGIAPESREARRALQRRIDAVFGTRAGVRNAVRFENGVADTEFRQDPVDPRVIAAFRKPESLGRRPNNCV